MIRILLDASSLPQTTGGLARMLRDAPSDKERSRLRVAAFSNETQPIVLCSL